MPPFERHYGVEKLTNELTNDFGKKVVVLGKLMTYKTQLQVASDAASKFKNLKRQM